ncbi:unnamed protein product [Meganyctiphanes norvegica]|uniref:Uncharacterized protein n=1 Tax=Meganyctiphanes norvegica TaxID=48144 RepID=A0AAV2R678_MEGNR
MAANKITMKFRSITFPNHEVVDEKKKRGKLSRTASFDLDPRDPTVSGSSPGRTMAGVSGCGISITQRSRNISAEGRLRVQQFQHTRSVSSTLVPGAGLQKTIRFSDECQCSPSVSLSPGARCQPRCEYCLSSQKSKSTNYLRHAGNTSTERLMDWNRRSNDRMNLSPSDDNLERRSRSIERRCDRLDHRRNHHCASVSLPPPNQLPSISVSDPSSPITGLPSASAAITGSSPPMSSEGRSRKSQFRRAWSLFTVSCDKEAEKREKSSQQRILRLPTRHVYRRGMSGLPIDCTPNYLGLAY